jgi:hypothetical protein
MVYAGGQICVKIAALGAEDSPDERTIRWICSNPKRAGVRASGEPPVPWTKLDALENWLDVIADIGIESTSNDCRCRL